MGHSRHLRPRPPMSARPPLADQSAHRSEPKEPARKILRSIYEEARDVARGLAKTEAFERSCRERKRIEMLCAHLKRILHLGRLRLRGPRGVRDLVCRLLRRGAISNSVVLPIE